MQFVRSISSAKCMGFTREIACIKQQQKHVYFDALLVNYRNTEYVSVVFYQRFFNMFKRQSYYFLEISFASVQCTTFIRH